MPQDPAQDIPEIGPGGGRSSGPGYAERQYQAQAYGMGDAKGRDAGTLGAALEESFARIPDVRKARYQGLQDALREYAAKQQDTFNTQVTRAGLKGPMDRLQQGSPNFGAFMGSYLTPLAGGVDAALDIGARLGDFVGTRLAGGDTVEPIPYDENDIFTPGPGLGTQALSGYRPKRDVQSGFLEAVTGGAKTPAEARKKFAEGFSGIDPSDMAKLRAQVADDDRREAEGQPRVLSDQETQAILSAEDPGLPGMAGDLTAMLALTPGGAARGIGGAVSRALPGAASKGAAGVVNRAVGQAAGEGIAFGATRGITEQSAEAGLHDAAFGAGIGGTGSAISSAVGSQAALKLLAAQSALRNRAVRYVGRTAAETAKLRAGRVAASFLEGGETPGEALDPNIAGELGPAALFALGTGRPMGALNARVARREETLGRREKSLERGQKNQAFVQDIERIGKGLQEAEIQGAKLDETIRDQGIEQTKAKLEADRKAKVAAKKDKPFVEAEARRDELPTEARKRRIGETQEKYEARLAERTQGRLKELGKEIQQDLDNQAARTSRETTEEILGRWQKRIDEVREEARPEPAPPVAVEPATAVKPAAPLGGTAAPAKPGRKPRAFTPAEQSWAREMTVKLGRGEQLTAAEKRKLKTLNERGQKAAAYEAAQRAEAQRQREAAASPDPRARLSDKGKSMVEQYTAAIKKPMDAGTFKALRDQFSKKIRQSAKWNEVVSKTTNETRVSETSELLKIIHSEAPDHIKKHLLDETQIEKEYQLRKALKAAKKSGDEKAQALIRQQLRGLKRKTTEAQVDRRAKNREEELTPEEVAQSGIAKKEGSEAVKAESTADDVVAAEADRQAKELEDLASKLDPDAFRAYYEQNSDAIAQDIADGNYGAVFEAMANLPRRTGEAEAGRIDIGALISGVRNIARALTGPNKTAAIKNFVQSFFGKSPALAAKKTNPFRSAAEWAVSMGREEIVTRTPEGPAKRMAEDLQALGDVATARSHEFVQRDGLLGDYADAQDASSALSTSQVKEMTAPTGTTGAADANWRGRYRAAAPKNAEEGKFFSALYKVIAKAWDNARAMGFLKDGKPLPQRGTAPYLPTMYSEPMLRALSEAGVGDWLKSVIKATQAKYTGKIKPDVVERIILGWKDAFSGDVSVRTAAERKHAIEFDRVIELPDYVDGIPTQVLNPQEYLVRYAKAISNRVGFESAMRGKDLKDLRGQFVTQGGDGRLFDAWADQAQGQWKNYNELVEGNEATGFVGKVANEVIQWAKTMKLTGSSVPNATSLIYGPLHQTYGWANTMKAAAQETALELSRFVRNLKAWGGSKAGRAMTRDFARSLQEANAFEKYQPHVTGSIFDTLINASRRARFALSRFTYRHINRLSDRVSARAMANFVDDLAKLKAAGKPMPSGRIDRLTMYLGLTKDQAANLLSGKATEAEKAFLSELSSQVFFGAARSPQSLSRAQKNPLIRMGIWFASHATKQARLLVRSYDQTVRDWKASAGQPFWKRSALTGLSAGRNIGGNLAAQTIAGTANLIAIAATHGDFVWEGDDSATWKSLTERPGDFGQNALLAAGVFGPLASTASRFSGQETVGEMLTKFISPVEIATNTKHWAMGTGPYKDQGDLLDRTLYGLTRRTPGPRIVSTLMAVAGLTARNVDTDNGIRAHYQYLRDQGQGFGGPRKMVPEEHAAMRAELKDALQTMVDGGDPTGLILKAIKAKGDDVRKVAASIRGMKLVDEIAPEEMGAYRRYMGDKQYEALLRRDALLEVWAQAILKAGGEGVPKTDAAKQKQLARVDSRLPAMIDADQAFAKAAGIAKQVQEIAKAKQALRRGASAEAIGTARALTGKRAENKLKGFDAQLIEGTRKRLKKRAEVQ